MSVDWTDLKQRVIYPEGDDLWVRVYDSKRASLGSFPDPVPDVPVGLGHHLQGRSIPTSLEDHGKVSSSHNEKTVLVGTFGPEELHNLNLAIDGELFDGSEALWCHTEDLKVVYLGQHKV